VAYSFLTDQDTDIMKDLLAYLKATGAEIPDQLARGGRERDDNFMK
jgi:hypothetical protein